MAIIRSANAADFAFETKSYAADKLLVTEFHGSEGISELFRFTVDLASTDHLVDFATIVGEPATLTIQRDGGERFVHGLVARFEQTGRGAKFTRYRALVVPDVWRLTRRHDCRIFQNQSVPDIVKKVLEGAGQLKFSLKGTHAPREYCVQYRESDWAFAARLLEEEGIFFFFDHNKEGHTLVMGDDPVVNVAIEDKATVPFRDPSLGETTEEHVYALQHAEEIRSGKVTLRDYEFGKPSLTLETEAAAKRDGKLEVYDYPGGYEDVSTGNGRAKARLEEFQAARAITSGLSDCRRLLPGHRFTLDDHSRADFNGEYLITSVQHWGRQPQSLAPEPGAAGATDIVYQNSFECIPSAVPFRPRRITPRPVVEGPQTAVVVGPAGEEIHTDKYGRIKVQFHWDRQGKKDQNSSCWMRVGHAWAGAAYGTIMIPRIGWEVVVDFLEGDPDRPLVTGCVYNGQNPPPYGLPGEKTKAAMKSNSSLGGGGYNEIRFEDRKGSEEIWIHGQKDENIVIENDKTQRVGHDESRSVGNDESVDIGKNETWHVGADRTKNVDGNQSETIGKDKTITVTGNHTESIAGSKTVDVSGSHTETISQAMTITVALALTETVGVNYAETVGAAMELTVGGTKTETVGSSSTETVGGSKNQSVGGSKGETVGGKKSVQIEGDLLQKVNGSTLDSAEKDYAIKAKKIIVEAGDEITLKTGSATIIMKKNGDISVQGNKITIKGSGDVTVKGSKVAVN